MAKPDWITISQDSGESGVTIITVEASSYSGLTNRTGQLTISSVHTTAQTVVNLSQKAFVPTLSISPASITSEWSGGTYYLIIYSDYNWSITKPSWITLSQSTGFGDTTVIVTLPKNYSEEDYLDGNIVITDSVNTITCPVRVDTFSGNNSDKYLTFKIKENGRIFGIRYHSRNSNYNTIAYSKDKGLTWNGFEFLESTSGMPVSAGETVMFRGNNPYYGENGSGCTLYCSGSYEIEGNIMSLVYGSNFIGQTELISGDTFLYLFRGRNNDYYNSKLTSIENLVLPATTLTERCYKGLFSGNTTITGTTPELPARVLSPNCYEMMYLGCTGLTTAPALPATSLASGCYYRMFMGCTSLTTPPPRLPATTVFLNSYNRMFANCTSLTTAPILSSDILGTASCCFMFDGCTSLETAPELPATVLSGSCYAFMFRGCTSLTTPPSRLPVTILEEDCYNGMFCNCSSLSAVSSNLLPAVTLKDGCYREMFYGCSSLVKAPELPATILVANNIYNGCYREMFKNCTSLNYIKTNAVEFNSSPKTQCTLNWVSNVAPSGEFYGKLDAGWTVDSIDGVPIGWTLMDIQLSPSAVTVNESLDEVEITITSFADWSITGPEWVYFSQSSGTSAVTAITITCSTNNSNTRTGTITITDTKNNSDTATVSQLKTYDIWLSSTEDNIPVSGGSVDLYVLSPFQNYVLETNDSWITIPQPTGTTTGRYKVPVTIQVDENNSLDFDNDRVGYISAFTEDRQHYYVTTVTQDKCGGGYLNISDGVFILSGYTVIGREEVYIFGSTPKSISNSVYFGGCGWTTSKFYCGRNGNILYFHMNDSENKGCTLEKTVVSSGYEWGVNEWLGFGWNMGAGSSQNKSFRLTLDNTQPVTGTGTNTDTPYINKPLAINGFNNNGTIEGVGSMSIKYIQIMYSAGGGSSLAPYAVNGVLCLKDSYGNIFYPTEGSTVSYTYTPLYN